MLSRPQLPMPRRSPNRSALLGLLLVLGTLLTGLGAQAQIVREKPAQVKAANRRALREAQRTESPYKDSHLDVTPGRLKRGESTQPQAASRTELDYKKGTAPNVKPVTFLGFRRNKASTLVRKEQRQKPKAEDTKAPEKK
ncbi:MAG: hypothetical protein JWR44_1039 [Hymenobacter sp.]|jgi:hypothetical protein|nr:hypothetical protein [Hymenobacter sp.]